MKRTGFIGAAFGVLAAAVLASTPAFAGPTYEFTVSTGGQPSDVATITLTQDGLDSVIVDMIFNDTATTHYGILNSGSHIPFGFQLDSAAEMGTVTVSFASGAPLNGTFIAKDGSTGHFSLASGHSASQSGFGTFNEALADSEGNGTNKAYYFPNKELKFTVTDTAGLDTNDFVQNADHVYFTADITDGSNTAAQAWETRIKTPEPATILLFGSVLAGMGWLGRRRKTAKA